MVGIFIVVLTTVHLKAPAVKRVDSVRARTQVLVAVLVLLATMLWMCGCCCCFFCCGTQPSRHTCAGEP